MKNENSNPIIVWKEQLFLLTMFISSYSHIKKIEFSNIKTNHEKYVDGGKNKYENGRCNAKPSFLLCSILNNSNDILLRFYIKHGKSNCWWCTDRTRQSMCWGEISKILFGLVWFGLQFPLSFLILLLRHAFNVSVNKWIKSYRSKRARGEESCSIHFEVNQMQKHIDIN